MKTNWFLNSREVAQMPRTMLRTLVFIVAVAPTLLLAQYSEIKMGEYLHYATAAANGGVYAGIDGIGYTTVFCTPSLYKTNTGWVDLPVARGFDTTKQIYGSTTAISHDGSVVAGSVTGTTTNGVSRTVAAYWVNGFESVVPAPPDGAPFQYCRGASPKKVHGFLERCAFGQASYGRDVFANREVQRHVERTQEIEGL